MKRSVTPFVLGALAWLAGAGATLADVARPFVSFDQFLQGVRSAKLESFALSKDARVQGDAEFGKMRQHVLSLYDRVTVTHSFALEDQVFDCVPVDQQPSLRGLGLDKADLNPPSPSIAADADATPDRSATREKAASPLTLGLQDAFGNAVNCAEGTIPLRRVTLEEMTRFRTLEGFFRKTPWSEGGPLEGLEPKAAAPVHKYAHATQSIKNYGGNSWLSLWSPSVSTGAGQIFSLSQHWYAGGSGKATQTVEGGWQVYPAKYETAKGVLFIYWTADGYTRTGCYNLDCAAFVQTNSHWALGGAWSSYSSRGGTSIQFQMQWKLADGKWWLFLQGAGEYEAVGYYQVSIFRGGQLTRFANRIDYGGETVGTTSWPPMGSGALPSAGSGQAAYQSRIFYISNPTVTDAGIWAALTTSQPSPRCYKLIYTPAILAGTTGTYFYFGGPGGRSC